MGGVDVHAHHLPAPYMALLQAGDGPVFGAPHDGETLLRMIEGQDEAGIAVQVLSTGPNSPYLHDRARAADAARLVNDSYHAVVERHGGRFAAFGSAPLPHGGAAASEAVRCLDDLRFAGMHFGCSALGRSLDDPAFSEMWTELDRRGAVVYVHPGGILCGTEPGLAGMDDAGLAVTIGSASELAVAALRLARLTRTHRRLKVVIGLLGGSLPFLLQRVLWLGGRFKGGVLARDEGEPTLIAQLRAFHYDTNLLPDPAVIERARVAFGLDRLLFGSDAPAAAPQVTADFMRAGGVSEAELEAILNDHPRALFGERLIGTRAARQPPSGASASM